MDSVLVTAGTVIIFAVFPWLVAFISGQQAFHALQCGVASWPRSWPRTTRHFSKLEEPIRYWLVIVLQLAVAVILTATPIIYFGSGYAHR